MTKEFENLLRYLIYTSCPGIRKQEVDAIVRNWEKIINFELIEYSGKKPVFLRRVDSRYFCIADIHKLKQVLKLLENENFEY